MKDRFSLHADQYAVFRPTYPESLYQFLASSVPGHAAVWDVGCGNGQVSRDLARYFDQVYATDISTSQLERAPQLENVHYSIGSAEQCVFQNDCFDLITVGQALHWFRIPEFFQEATRVGKEGGVVAVWCYSLLTIDSLIDPLLLDFYVNVIGPYWDPERKLVDEQYKTIDFPFEEIDCPPFQFSCQWSLADLQGYLTTWSSVQKYIAQYQKNPVVDLIEKIHSLWGQNLRTVSFPLFARVGRIRKSFLP
jgi:SAM-dependent methyltransferase